MSPLYYDLYLILTILCFLIARGIWESLRLRTYLKAIPIRIHVNGSRGKSSVTRLIAAGLRASGLKVLAKTTGTIPTLILPDGREERIKRWGRSSIREDISVLRRAWKEGAQALVIECMAIRPEIQSISKRIVRSKYAVITNVRPDHVEEMGGSLEAVARTFCRILSPGQVLFTSEDVHLPIIEEEAKRKGARMNRVASEARVISPLDFSENLSLALEVCKFVGVEPQVALRGITEAAPDPGALKAYSMKRRGKEITFINAFSANDPESAWRIYEKVKGLGLIKAPFFILLNNRLDRPYRAVRFGELMAKLNPEQVILVGGLKWLARRATIRAGFPKERIKLKGGGAKGIVELLFQLTNESATVLGLGNFAGLGERILCEICCLGEASFKRFPPD